MQGGAVSLPILRVMSDLLLPALVAFIYVFLRAFQQLNVVHRNYYMVMPTSIFMSFGDVLLVMFIVKVDSLWLGLTNGVAAGLGCMLAMWLSHVFWGKRK